MKTRKRKPGPSSKDLGLVSADAGKGDVPRNCFSEDYRSNFDEIKWSDKSGRKESARTIKVYR